MYKREDVAALVKMVEVGVLSLRESAGLEVIGVFSLADWDAAFTAAAAIPGAGMQTLIAP